MLRGVVVLTAVLTLAAGGSCGASTQRVVVPMPAEERSRGVRDWHAPNSTAPLTTAPGTTAPVTTATSTTTAPVTTVTSTTKAPVTTMTNTTTVPDTTTAPVTTMTNTTTVPDTTTAPVTTVTNTTTAPVTTVTNTTTAPVTTVTNTTTAPVTTATTVPSTTVVPPSTPAPTTTHAPTPPAVIPALANIEFEATFVFYTKSEFLLSLTSTLGLEHLILDYQMPYNATTRRAVFSFDATYMGYHSAITAAHALHNLTASELLTSLAISALTATALPIPPMNRAFQAKAPRKSFSVMLFTEKVDAWLVTNGFSNASLVVENQQELSMQQRFRPLTRGLLHPVYSADLDAKSAAEQIPPAPHPSQDITVSFHFTGEQAIAAADAFEHLPTIEYEIFGIHDVTSKPIEPTAAPMTTAAPPTTTTTHPATTATTTSAPTTSSRPTRPATTTTAAPNTTTATTTSHPHTTAWTATTASTTSTPPSTPAPPTLPPTPSGTRPVIPVWFNIIFTTAFDTTDSMAGFAEAAQRWAARQGYASVTVESIPPDAARHDLTIASPSHVPSNESSWKFIGGNATVAAHLFYGLSSYELLSWFGITVIVNAAEVLPPLPHGLTPGLNIEFKYELSSAAAVPLFPHRLAAFLGISRGNISSVPDGAIIRFHFVGAHHLTVAHELVSVPHSILREYLGVVGAWASSLPSSNVAPKKRGMSTEAKYVFITIGIVLFIVMMCAACAIKQKQLCKCMRESMDGDDESNMSTVYEDDLASYRRIR